MTELYHNYKSRIHRCHWQNSSSLSLCDAFKKFSKTECC